MIYSLVLIVFLYVLMSPNPVYGVSGSRQALFLVRNKFFHKSDRCCQQRWIYVNTPRISDKCVCSSDFENMFHLRSKTVWTKTCLLRGRIFSHGAEGSESSQIKESNIVCNIYDVFILENVRPILWMLGLLSRDHWIPACNGGRWMRDLHGALADISGLQSRIFESRPAVFATNSTESLNLNALFMDCHGWAHAVAQPIVKSMGLGPDQRREPGPCHRQEQR